VKTVKVLLNKKKSDPIVMKDKEDSNVDSERTEAVSATIEIEISQQNLKRNMHSDDLEDKQIDTVSHDKVCTSSSVRQK
jgi:hypothetical protein